MRSLSSTAAGLAVALTLGLGACSSPPKPVPVVTAPVAGSAPGPVYGQTPPGTTRSWSPQMEETEKALSSALSGSGATVSKTTDERLWVTLPGDLAFEPNRSALKPSARTLLDKVVVALRKLPDPELRIVGHTDSKGAAAANDALSLDRAASTRDWLVARGQSPVRISVAGRGSRDPLGSNDDEAGRAKNRRVEILIGDKAKVSASSASPSAK
jgi:outer membrane protein OmpA-like peptidoglycan-associated protein